jgi:hypothetical protein
MQKKVHILGFTGSPDMYLFSGCHASSGKVWDALHSLDDLFNGLIRLMYL